ncbi:STAS domain-containing protein [Acidithiobacillus sp. AMEEHan]|uniref:STAS domain-containing protein n=1 Tax=Acidithiobacillus sp. AMEEHan TaxID=2994951 RepID=UPI0027E59A30|nr:STAS domain-containing protein [Acidithiobacillus sp. AMEEHan]
MPAEASWERDSAGGLLLRGDWRLRPLDQRLRRDAASLLRQRWEYLSLAKVTALDSATLAFVIDWQSIQRSLGSSAELRNPPATLLDLAKLYGLTQLWQGDSHA